MIIIKEFVLCVLLVLVLETHMQRNLSSVVEPEPQRWIVHTTPPSVDPSIYGSSPYGPMSPGFRPYPGHPPSSTPLPIGRHPTPLAGRLGCYKDNAENRMFKGHMTYLHSQGSNRNCVEFCKSKRFVYAGTQSG